jgi:hypothetical protein
MQAEILSDIPLPNRPTGPRSELGRLLSTVKPGQSFVTKMQRETVYSLARYYGIRVAIRTSKDGEMRVWRIDQQPTTKKAKNKNDENASRIHAKQG